jgi:hypothetical protein
VGKRETGGMILVKWLYLLSGIQLTSPLLQLVIVHKS